MDVQDLPTGLAALEEFTKAGGPYIGPRGGKWADPQHTIAWDEKIHGKGKQGDLFGGGEKKPEGKTEDPPTFAEPSDEEKEQMAQAAQMTEWAQKHGTAEAHERARSAHNAVAEVLSRNRYHEDAAQHRRIAEGHKKAAEKKRTAAGNGRPSARELTDAPEGSSWELHFKDGRHLEVRRDSEGYSLHDLSAVGAPKRKSGLAPHDAAEWMAQAEKVTAGKKPKGKSEIPGVQDESEAAHQLTSEAQSNPSMEAHRKAHEAHLKAAAKLKPTNERKAYEHSVAAVSHKRAADKLEAESLPLEERQAQAKRANYLAAIAAAEKASEEANKLNDPAMHRRAEAAHQEAAKHAGSQFEGIPHSQRAAEHGRKAEEIAGGAARERSESKQKAAEAGKTAPAKLEKTKGAFTLTFHGARVSEFPKKGKEPTTDAKMALESLNAASEAGHGQDHEFHQGQVDALNKRAQERMGKDPSGARKLYMQAWAHAKIRDMKASGALTRDNRHVVTMEEEEAYAHYSSMASSASDKYGRAVDRGDNPGKLHELADQLSWLHSNAAAQSGGKKREGHLQHAEYYRELKKKHAEDERKQPMSPEDEPNPSPPKFDTETRGFAGKSLPALSALDEFAKANRPIPLPTSGRAASIASMRAAQGVDSEGNAKKAEQIPGGLASGKKPEDFSAEALAAGTKVELEHTKDRKVAQEIAMDHLAEDPAYYEKLARMEGKKEKAMDAKKSGLDGLAEFAGAEPMEKSGREDSIYDSWHRYSFNAGGIVRTARDWASGFWCTRPAGIALRARAFRVAERLADLTQEWGALKAQERQTRTDYENETPAQRSARNEQEEARWKALEAQVEPVLEEARECDRELLRIRSLEAQQEAGEASAAKSMPPWEDLQKSFYESKDVLEWTGGFWDDKFKARAAELAKKLLAHRQKRSTSGESVKMGPPKADEEDKIIREMHGLEIEWLEAEKKKAEKRAKVEAATKSLEPVEIRLAPGVDCTRQPHAAVAHAQAVIDSRVRAARDAGVTLGTPGPTPPPAPPAPVVGPAYVQKGGGMVIYGTGADRAASELAKGGGFYHGQAPRLPGLEPAQCPACGGGLVKAVTDCPHCGALARSPDVLGAPAVAAPGPAREGQPRLQPAREQVVDGREGLALDADDR